MADNRLSRLVRALSERASGLGDARLSALGGDLGMGTRPFQTPNGDGYLGPPATIRQGGPTVEQQMRIAPDFMGYDHPIWAMRHGRPPNPGTQQPSDFTPNFTPQTDASGNVVQPNQPTGPVQPTQPIRQPGPNRMPNPIGLDPWGPRRPPNDHGPVVNKPNWPDWYTGGKRPEQSYGVPNSMMPPRDGRQPNRAPGPIISDPARPFNSHGPILNKPPLGGGRPNGQGMVMGGPGQRLGPMDGFSRPITMGPRGQVFSGGRN